MGQYNVIGLQPTKTRAELDSSTVLKLNVETNILRVSPVKYDVSIFFKILTSSTSIWFHSHTIIG